MDPTPSLASLVDALGSLPGIGRKTAEKLAYHLMKSSSDAKNLSGALADVSRLVRPCVRCFNYAEGELCTICLDPKRISTILCVVSTPKDLAAIESTGAFKGLYHVLYNEVMTGVPTKTINNLKERLDATADKVEVILATNPDSDGDALALEIKGLLSTSNVEISQLARGISIGASIEFLRPETLAGALTNRQTV